MDSAHEMSKIGFIDAHRDAKLEEHDKNIKKILLGINALLECDRENKEMLERMSRKVQSCMDIVYSIERQLVYSKADHVDRMVKLIPVCCFATVGFCFAAIKIFGFIFS